MTTSHREIEEKFEATEDFSMPDLAQVPGVASITEPEVLDLEAAYFDTPDLRLVAHQITLRRRTGGGDEGWHLKLPGTDGSREEVHAPLGRATRTPPKALRSLVRVHTRDQPLGLVARLRNRRTVRRLLTADGAVLAEVTDDAVTAESLGEEVVIRQWRELEAELVGGDRDLLAAVGATLLGAGARASGSASKLAQALGDRVPVAPLIEPASPESTAREAVLAHLTDQVDTIIRYDPRVRRDEYDSIHKMRVGARRLRSALRTYRPLLESEETEPIRDELRWLGMVLGAARDREVMLERLTEVVDSEPTDLVVGPVANRIRTHLTGSYRAAHDVVLTELDGDRYLRLVDTLEALVVDPPFVATADDRATDVLPALAGSAWRKVRRSVKAADQAETPQDREHLLHDVRKAAKRARYAAESLQAVVGAEATAFGKQMEAVQEILGEQQDSVVTRALLRELGMQAHLAGENGFSYGRLHALEQSRSDHAVAQFADVWDTARRARHRRWMRGS